jgi:hypothetical protein
MLLFVKSVYEVFFLKYDSMSSCCKFYQHVVYKNIEGDKGVVATRTPYGNTQADKKIKKEKRKFPLLRER